MSAVEAGQMSAAETRQMSSAGPIGLEIAVAFTGANSQVLATILEPFWVIFMI